jgi:hypothetical protein
MCKWGKLNYNDTLNRLHEFDVENSIKMYSNKNFGNKRYTKDEKMHNSTEKGLNNKDEYCN